MIFFFYKTPKFDGWIFNYLCISAYHHYRCEFEPRSWRGVLDTILCDKICQWLATGWWFSPGTPVSSNIKTDCHDITEILLKVALNTINQTQTKKSKLHQTITYPKSKSYWVWWGIIRTEDVGSGSDTGNHDPGQSKNTRPLVNAGCHPAGQ
jgi:hypothetical protein